jgi:hypothetical protein
MFFWPPQSITCRNDNKAFPDLSAALLEQTPPKKPRPVEENAAFKGWCPRKAFPGNQHETHRLKPLPFLKILNLATVARIFP